jgi:hypothetical protein
VGGFYLLNRKVEVMGDDAWMMHDLLRQDGPGFLTTDPPPTSAAAGVQAVARVAALDGGFDVAVQGPESPSPIFAADVYIPRHKRYVPGAAFPGEYQIEAPTIPLGFVAFPSFPMNALVGIWNLALEGSGDGHRDQCRGRAAALTASCRPASTVR